MSELRSTIYRYISKLQNYPVFCRRLNEQNVPYDVKRQRFHSPHRDSTLVNQTVPLPEERRYSFPGSVPSPLFHTHYLPDLTGCVPPLQDSFPDPIETTLPVAKDKVTLTLARVLHDHTLSQK